MIRRAALVAVCLAMLAGCDSGAADDDMADIPGLGATRIDVPRPTGLTSVPCDDDPLPPSSPETTVQRVAALRAIGLFADRTDMSDEALASEVDAGIEELWGTDLTVDDPLRDLAVAEQDRDRVLWIDLEADVVAENEVYVQTLAYLAAISAGAFRPTDVAETWAGETGPIAVTFAQDGEPHSLRPAYIDDWIDPMILVAVNESIADSGRRFELYKAFDQTAVVMALTDAERGALESRGWCFE